MTALAAARFKKTPVVLALLIAAGAALLVAAICDLLQLPLPPRPSLLRALAPTYSDVTRDLQERYPVGSPEASLIRELRAEGFELPASPSPQRVARFDTRGRGNFDICRIMATIAWAADQRGLITSISAQASETCP